MNVTIRIPDWARRLASDHTDMTRDPHPVDATRVKSFSLELPDDVYYEYGFLDDAGDVRADPENDVRAENPWYPDASAVHGSDYRPHETLALERRSLPGRTIRHRIRSEHLGQERRVTIYTPDGHEDRELPVVIAQDGQAFFRLANTPMVLEWLLERSEARAAHLVFLEPVDRQAEYGFFEPYRRFVLEEVEPYVRESLRATDERVLMGASLGGLASATIALLNPGYARTVVAFSGAFLGAPDDRRFYRSERSWVLERLRDGGGADARWFTSTGTIEWLRDVNREVHEALEGMGVPHAYEERNAGHNWTNWRNSLPNALAFALEPQD